MRLRRRDVRRLNCMQVGRILQTYLDDRTDPRTAERVAAHLADCKRCGMKAAEYRAIKRALANRALPADGDAVERLRDFGLGLVRGDGSEGVGDRVDTPG